MITVRFLESLKHFRKVHVGYLRFVDDDGVEKWHVSARNNDFETWYAVLEDMLEAVRMLTGLLNIELVMPSYG